MRSSLVWMRSSLVVRASDCQCTSCNGPGFDPSIRRHSGIWGAADEAVLNIVRTKRKKSPKKIFKKKKKFILDSHRPFICSVSNNSQILRRQNCTQADTKLRSRNIISKQSYSFVFHGPQDHSPHLPLQEISIEENLPTPRGRKERNPLGNYLESVADNPGWEENNKPMLMCTKIFIGRWYWKLYVRRL